MLGNGGEVRNTLREVDAEKWSACEKYAIREVDAGKWRECEKYAERGGCWEIG